jgi:hypothetical protein
MDATLELNHVTTDMVPAQTNPSSHQKRDLISKYGLGAKIWSWVLKVPETKIIVLARPSSNLRL